MKGAQPADQECKHTVQKTYSPAIGYTRVSTDEQLQGNGLEVQEQAVRRFCKANNLRLLGLASDEGISGSNGLDARVGLASALARLEAGEADCLVVYRLDRLARDFVLQETSRQPVAGTREADPVGHGAGYRNGH